MIPLKKQYFDIYMQIKHRMVSYTFYNTRSTARILKISEMLNSSPHRIAK